jgi:protein phosphatase
VRRKNEDSAYAGRWLHAVADGLGGHPAGDVASAAVISTVQAWDTEQAAADPLASLASAIQAASSRLADMITADESLRGMGTTLTAVLMPASGGHLAVANIGDSRAYLLRSGKLHRLTEDHVIGNLAGGAPGRIAGMLARYLDGRLDRSADLTLRQAVPGDRYLLCTDGLTATVPAAAIHEILAATAGPADAVSSLIALANNAGGPDNITAVIVDLTTGS